MNAPAPIPQVSCDLCQAPCSVPVAAIVNGQIIGLITCSQCIEDALEARKLEEAA